LKKNEKVFVSLKNEKLIVSNRGNVIVINAYMRSTLKMQLLHFKHLDEFGNAIQCVCYH
jgi:hypothetical protein